MNANPPAVAFAGQAIRYAWVAVGLCVMLGFSAGCSLVSGRGVVSVSYEAVLDGPYQVTITPSKMAGYPGEPVNARLTIKNIGTRSIWVPVPLSQCRLDVHFDPVDEILIDDPFVVSRLTCRKLQPGTEMSIEREFVVPATTARCEFYTGYSSQRSNTVSFTVLQHSKAAPAISAN